MTDDKQTLAARLAAHPRWRWMPGMLAVGESREWWRVSGPAEGYVEASALAVGESTGVDMWERSEPHPPIVPDLSDRATIGCLVGMLREVHPDAVVWPDRGEFCVLSYLHISYDDLSIWHVAKHHQEGPAVALALLAAWGDV